MRYHQIIIIVCLTIFRAAYSHAAPKPFILASFPPVAEMTRGVAGDLADVRTLQPPSVSCHETSLTPRQRSLLGEADLLVFVGLGNEAYLDRTIQSLPRKRANVIEAAAGLDHRYLQRVTKLAVARVGSGDHDHDHAHEEHDDHEGHDHGKGEPCPAEVAVNPHVWLDPVLATEMVTTIAKELGRFYPEHAGQFERNAEAYRGKLMRLHADIQASLATLPRQSVATFHDAFRYFFARYGLPLGAVVRADPESAPTPQEMKELLADLAEHQIKVVFSEPQLDDALARRLAKTRRLRVASLNPIGAESTDGSAYLDLLRSNAKAYVAALTAAK